MTGPAAPPTRFAKPVTPLVVTWAEMSGYHLLGRCYPDRPVLEAAERSVRHNACRRIRRTSPLLKGGKARASSRRLLRFLESTLPRVSAEPFELSSAARL